MKTNLEDIQELRVYRGRFGNVIQLTDGAGHSVAYADNNPTEVSDFSRWFALLTPGEESSFYTTGEVVKHLEEAHAA